MKTVDLDQKVADVYIKEAFSIWNEAEVTNICAGIEDVPDALTPLEVKRMYRKAKHGEPCYQHIPWKAVLAAVLVAVLGISFWAGAETGLIQTYYNQIQERLNQMYFQSCQNDVVTLDGRPSDAIYAELQAEIPDVALIVADSLPAGTKLMKADGHNGEILLVYHFADDSCLTIMQHPGGKGEPYRLPLQDNTTKDETVQILGESANGTAMSMQDGTVSYYFVWKNDTVQNDRPNTEYNLIYSGKQLNSDRLSEILFCIKYFS